VFLEIRGDEEAIELSKDQLDNGAYEKWGIGFGFVEYIFVDE